MARPKKYTEERQEALVNAIRMGAPGGTAAGYAGIGSYSYYAWRRLGDRELTRREAGETPDPGMDWAVAFTIAVDEAKAAFEVRNVGLIQRAAQDTWQAAAWLLERRHPDRYGRVTRSEVSGPQGAPVQVATVDSADLEAKVNALIALRGQDDVADKDGDGE